KREAATIAGYRTYFERHIGPRLGSIKLAALTTPRVEKFRDDLLEGGASRSLAKKVIGALKSILKDAKRRGNVAQNVATDVKVDTRGRHKERPKNRTHNPQR